MKSTTPDNRWFIRYTGLAIGSALLSLWVPSDYVLIGTGILSLAGGLAGANTLLRVPESRFDFFLVAPVVIVLASSAGMLFSFISLTLVSYDIWEITLEYAHTTTTDNSLAQGYTNAFALALLGLGSRWQPPDRIRQLCADATTCLQDHRRVVLLWVVFLLSCQAYLYTIGVIVYGGKDLAESGEPTHPLLAMIAPLVPILPFVAAYYVRKSRVDGNWLQTGLFAGLLLVELGWFFLFGRRSVIFFFLLAAAGLFHGMALNVRYLLRNSLPILIVCFGALALADTYHKMRSMYGFEGVQRMNMTDVLAGLPDADEERYGQIRKMNVAGRAAYSSLALGQFVNLFRTTEKSPLLGQSLMNSLLCATPSDLLVDKRSVLVKEFLYESAFSLSLTDISETLYLESFIDFGWLGFLIYPLFLFVLLCPLYVATVRVRQPVFSVFVGCVSLFLSLSMTEMDMITFLATVRTLFVGYLLALLWRKPASRYTESITADNPDPLLTA